MAYSQSLSKTQRQKKKANSLAELGRSLALWLCLAPTLVFLGHVGWEEAGDQVLVHGTHVLLFQPAPEVTAHRIVYYCKTRCTCPFVPTHN